MTTTRGTPRSGGRACRRKSTKSSPFQVRAAAHQVRGGGALAVSVSASFSVFSAALRSGPGAARAAGTFTRRRWGLSWGTSGRRRCRHQVWVGGRQGPSRFRPGRRGRGRRWRLFFKVVQFRPGRGRPFRILPVAQAVLGAPVRSPHQVQVLAHRGRPHHDPLLLGQGLRQLRGRPGALARQQPVQGPPHLPAPFQVRSRSQLPVAHGLEALLLELADRRRIVASQRSKWRASWGTVMPSAESRYISTRSRSRGARAGSRRSSIRRRRWRGASWTCRRAGGQGPARIARVLTFVRTNGLHHQPARERRSRPQHGDPQPRPTGARHGPVTTLSTP